MKIRIILTSLLVLCLYNAPLMAQDESEHVIKYRQYLMSSISSHYKSLKYLTSGKISQPQQWLPHSKALNEMAKMVAGAFPDDSDFGETDAKESIWNNKDDFNLKAEDLVHTSEALIKQIENNNKQGVAEQMDNIGQSCKSCHKKYREK